MLTRTQAVRAAARQRLAAAVELEQSPAFPDKLENLQLPQTLLHMARLVLVLAVVIAWPLSGLFSRGGYSREIYKYALTFGNFSFMGNAIVPAILGQEMLYKYMLFILPLTVSITMATGLPTTCLAF